MALVRYGGQDELGGHLFFQDDGQELYVPDMPEARRIAASLQTQSDMRLAQNANAPDTDIDAPPQEEPSVADVPQASGATGQEPGVMRSGVARGSQVVLDNREGAPPPIPGVAAPGTAQTAAAPPNKYALTPQQIDAELNRPAPYSPGVSQKQLAAKAKTGVPVPASQTVEVSGAVPQHPDIEAAWVASKKAEFEAQQRIADANSAAADTAQLKSVVDQFHYQDQLERKQMQVDALKQEAQNKIKIVQNFDQEAQARYADFGPDRYFKQKGTWATIGAAIMQGLGAWAAITGRTQNFAMEIIQRTKDADVQAQRDEYMRDKDARNNLVADIARATGDLDVATEAAKAIQMNIMASHAAEMAALSKRTDVANNWKLWEAQFQAGVVEHMQKAYERSLGNTVLKTTAQVKYPQAPGGGGPLTLQQKTARLKAINAYNSEAAKVGLPPMALTPEEQHAINVSGAKAKADATAKTQAKQQGDLTESAAALSTTLQGVTRMRELSGVKSRVGVGKVGTAEYMEGQALVEDTRLGFAKIKTGGVVTESDKANAAKVIPDITSVTERSGAKLDAIERRAKQEYINRVRAVDPSARTKKPSQILLEAGVQAKPDKDDKELQ